MGEVLLDAQLLGTLLYAVTIAIATAIGYYIAKKQAWWEVNLAVLSKGDWIETRRPIMCYAGQEVVGPIELPKHTVGQVVGINGRKRIELKLHTPITRSGQKISRVWDISYYDKLLPISVPESHPNYQNSIISQA